MPVDFDVGSALGCLETVERRLYHVLVSLLLKVDKHAILTRELQLVEVLRDHLLRLNRMVVLLICDETADRLLCPVHLRKLHLKQLVQHGHVLA